MVAEKLKWLQDGVDNTDVDSSRLYTQPEEVWQVYETLSAVPNGNFTVAAAFGNVHGVYAPGNVSLKPVILHNTQKYIKDTWFLWKGVDKIFWMSCLLVLYVGDEIYMEKRLAQFLL